MTLNVLLRVKDAPCSLKDLYDPTFLNRFTSNHSSTCDTIYMRLDNFKPNLSDGEVISVNFCVMD